MIKLKHSIFLVKENRTAEIGESVSLSPETEKDLISKGWADKVIKKTTKEKKVNLTKK